MILRLGSLLDLRQNTVGASETNGILKTCRHGNFKLSHQWIIVGYWCCWRKQARKEILAHLIL